MYYKYYFLPIVCYPYICGYFLYYFYSTYKRGYLYESPKYQTIIIRTKSLEGQAAMEEVSLSGYARKHILQENIPQYNVPSVMKILTEMFKKSISLKWQMNQSIYTALKKEQKAYGKPYHSE